MLTGGAENMSQMPFVVRNTRFGTALGSKYEFEDSLWLGLLDTHCGLPMGMTAEKLGAKFGVTREEVDNFALRSQHTWEAGKIFFLVNKILIIFKPKFFVLKDYNCKMFNIFKLYYSQ